MFIEFGPSYFDYMAKVLYHNYPCCLAKILGAFVIKQKTKLYILVLENLNLGIKPEEEPHIVRYDLKGSKKNRFIDGNENLSQV